MGEHGRDGHTADKKLTVEELGRLIRDIVLGHPTKVVLDNPTKLKTFRSLRAAECPGRARVFPTAGRSLPCPIRRSPAQAASPELIVLLDDLVVA